MQRPEDGSDVTGFGSFDNSTRKRVLDLLEPGDTIRYDTRCYFNVRSKADMSAKSTAGNRQLKMCKNTKTKK